jgi:predicted AAA+ superfamily ATPase
MIDRVKSGEVMTKLDEFPAVALYGARQVGKTTLARQIAQEVGAVYFDLQIV